LWLATPCGNWRGPHAQTLCPYAITPSAISPIVFLAIGNGCTGSSEPNIRYQLASFVKDAASPSPPQTSAARWPFRPPFTSDRRVFFPGRRNDHLWLGHQRVGDIFGSNRGVRGGLPSQIELKLHRAVAVGHEVREPAVVENHGQHAVSFCRRVLSARQHLLAAKSHQRGISANPQPVAFWCFVVDPTIDRKIVATSARKLILVGNERLVGWYNCRMEFLGGTGYGPSRAYAAGGAPAMLALLTCPSELGRHESPGSGASPRTRRCGTPTGSPSPGSSSHRRDTRGACPM